VNSTSDTVRVLVVDDDPNIAEALRALFESEPDFEVVAVVTDAGEVISSVERLSPTVVVLDIRMPGTDGVQMARQLRVRAPETGIVAFSAFGDAGSVARMKQVGVAEYLVKGAPNAEIVATVRRLAGRPDAG
jgi:DNA-binding NarL/FixJ family response regulator